MNITSTGDANDVAFFTTSLYATADWTEIGKEEDVELGIAYSTNSQDLSTNRIAQFMSTAGYNEANGYVSLIETNGQYSAELSNLTSNTHYYYCAYTQIGTKYYVGETKDFTTKSMTDYVLTGDATDVKSCTANLVSQYKMIDLLQVNPSLGSPLYYVAVAPSEEELADTTKRKTFQYNTASVSSQPASVRALSLMPKTKYYYQAVAKITHNGNTYEVLGEVKNFITQDIQQSGAVDLGLSCKWAAYDLGASSPATTGDFYAFADPNPIADVNNYHYPYTNITDFYGMSENISGTEYDAATKQLGSPWRMPTKDEVNELIKNCPTVEGDYNGLHGVFFTSENGNAIFMGGNYAHWTSYFYWRPGSIQPEGAYCFAPNSISETRYSQGLYIRPVQ